MTPRLFMTKLGLHLPGKKHGKIARSVGAIRLISRKKRLQVGLIPAQKGNELPIAQNDRCTDRPRQ